MDVNYLDRGKNLSTSLYVLFPIETPSDLKVKKTCAD